MGVYGACCSMMREILPHIDIVFDRYRMRALINHAIAELRREQRRELDRLEQLTLKGIAWIIQTREATVNISQGPGSEVCCAGWPHPMTGPHDSEAKSSSPQASWWISSRT